MSRVLRLRVRVHPGRSNKLVKNYVQIVTNLMNTSVSKIWYHRPLVTTSSFVGISTSIFLRIAIIFKFEQLQTSSPNRFILNCAPFCGPSNAVTTWLLHCGLSCIKYGKGTSTTAKPIWTLTRSPTTALNSPNWFSYLPSWKLGRVLIRRRLNRIEAKQPSPSQYGGGGGLPQMRQYISTSIKNFTTIIATARGVRAWVPSWACRNVF